MRSDDRPARDPSDLMDEDTAVLRQQMDLRPEVAAVHVSRADIEMFRILLRDANRTWAGYDAGHAIIRALDQRMGAAMDLRSDLRRADATCLLTENELETLRRLHLKLRASGGDASGRQSTHLFTGLFADLDHRLGAARATPPPEPLRRPTGWARTGEDWEISPTQMFAWMEDEIRAAVEAGIGMTRGDIVRHMRAQFGGHAPDPDAIDRWLNDDGTRRRLEALQLAAYSPTAVGVTFSTPSGLPIGRVTTRPGWAPLLHLVCAVAVATYALGSLVLLVRSAGHWAASVMAAALVVGVVAAALEIVVGRRADKRAAAAAGDR